MGADGRLRPGIKRGVSLAGMVIYEPTVASATASRLMG